MKVVQHNMMDTWDTLPVWQRLKIIDLWTLVIMIANFCHFISSLMQLFPHLFKIESHYPADYVFGLGTFLIWISLTMYLQFDNKLNDLPFTAIKATSNVLRNLIQMLPIMVGLTCFNLGYLGTSWRFNSFQHGMIMMWANYNGDELQNMHMAFLPEYALICPIMLYFWIFVSNDLIHSVFLALIEDGFVEQS